MGNQTFMADSLPTWGFDQDTNLMLHPLLLGLLPPKPLLKWSEASSRGCFPASVIQALSKPQDLWVLSGKKFRKSSPFGKRVHPISGKESFHNGIDIAAPSGTPIISPSAGVVTLYHSRDTSSGGLMMKVKLADGSTIGMAHLSELNPELKLGSAVSRGQVLAFTGNTGGSTGPHLHFTLRDPDDKIIDPTTWFGA